jgi:sirohydrochlorin ferrochelatase
MSTSADIYRIVAWKRDSGKPDRRMRRSRDSDIIAPMSTAIIIVDHGSRLAESNAMLEEVARAFHRRFERLYDIVEPAHMELAEPSIATAFARCVARGAKRVVVCPYFLGPGKHWTSDIPRLTAEAAARHPGTAYHVTPTLGIDDLILDLLNKRIARCLENDYQCERCKGTLRSGEPHPCLPATPASAD